MLRDQRDRLHREIEALQAELRRVSAAIEALSAQDLFDELSEAHRRRRMPGSLKQMAYTVLRERGQALSALDILQKIETEFGVRIERTSMSPQLSRLGQDEFLLREGNLWRINPARTGLGDTMYLLRESS
jgi:hypothetical protein